MLLNYNGNDIEMQEISGPQVFLHFPSSSRNASNLGAGDSCRFGGRAWGGDGRDLIVVQCQRAHPPKQQFSPGEMTSVVWRSVVTGGDLQDPLGLGNKNLDKIFSQPIWSSRKGCWKSTGRALWAELMHTVLHLRMCSCAFIIALGPSTPVEKFMDWNNLWWGGWILWREGKGSSMGMWCHQAHASMLPFAPGEQIFVGKLQSPLCHW